MDFLGYKARRPNRKSGKKVDSHESESDYEERVGSGRDNEEFDGREVCL